MLALGFYAVVFWSQSEAVEIKSNFQYDNYINTVVCLTPIKTSYTLALALIP